MNIVMMTNTYQPIIGGLERSVETLTREFRGQGHRVLIVVPEIEKGSRGRSERGIFRVPAITHYNHTQFPLQLPVPSALSAVLRSFAPDIIHSHHPFLIGDTALRASASFGVPLVFTMHTMYEKYTHYLPLDSAALKRFIIHLATGYANLCDHVIAPTTSVSGLLRRRGVKTRLSVVPSGIRIEEFSRNRGGDFRGEAGIPAEAFVVGSVSRIAREKNIDFLIRALAGLMEERAEVHFLLVGAGPLARQVRLFFERKTMLRRLHLPGPLRGKRLAEAYRSMDVFAFSSLSETQGIVLAEAMAAGVPVVALDAPGSRDIVEDGVNGRLLAAGDERAFARALDQVRGLDQSGREAMRNGCLRAARRFSSPRIACRVLNIYSSLIKEERRGRSGKNRLAGASQLIKAEWRLMLNLARSAGKAVLQK